MADPDRDSVLQAVRAGGGQYGKRELAKALRLKGDERIALKHVLRELVDSGELVVSGRHSYSIAKPEPEAEGDSRPGVLLVEIVDTDPDGELLARPDKGEGPLIRMAPGEGRAGRGDAALGVGDRALVRLVVDEDGVTVGRLIKRLGQSAHRILCVVEEDAGRMRLRPVDRRSKHDLVPAKDDRRNLKDGELVMVEIAKERVHGQKTARIVERVGRADEARAASVISLASHGVPQGFAEAEIAQAEAAKSPQVGTGADLRAISFVTIDPDDARDFDDAVYAEPDEDDKNPGGWIVWVAIADVARYVPPGSPLDKGALKRGNSVYLPDRVVPMLPERLSNDLCSLRPLEDRACMAVRMVFDAQGNKRGQQFHRGVMRSAARLTYKQAQAAFMGTPGPEAQPVLESTLKPIWAAYQVLKTAREQRSPLNITSMERKVRVNEAGEVVSITRYEIFDAHKLIEEFMIMANVCAAETLEQKRTPLIYRVHDEPSREKLTSLAEYLPQLGLKWSLAQPATPKRFNALLAQASEGEQSDIVNEVVLRSQSQAVYASDNIGHFGLNLERYAHFTSPIRRYADLVVHRALTRALKLGDDGLTDSEISRLARTAEDITACERRAVAAERDAVDRYIAAFLADRVGSTFEGRIAGVTRFGAFVRLAETGADGLVPVSSMGEEYFHHDERAHALVGQRTGGRYRLGQRVTVKLQEAMPITGGLIFEMVTPPEKGEAPKGGDRGGDRGFSRTPTQRRGGPGRGRGGAQKKGPPRKGGQKGPRERG